jgi:predicted peptidase
MNLKQSRILLSGTNSKCMKKILVLFAGLFFFADIQSQDLRVFEKKAFIRGADTLRYRVSYPPGYQSGRKYPLLVFLHGSGERGNDNEAQLMHGGRLFASDSVRTLFPAIVIFPQCPKDSTWNYIRAVTDSVTKNREFVFPDGNATVPAMLVKQLVDDLAASGKVDTRRLYLGGLSLGGMGTFDLLARYPGFFAAAFPICGAGPADNGTRFAQKTAVWIFHGEKDPVVDVKYSRAYYQVLQKAKADVKYSEYAGVGHDSWNNAFAEKGLLEWLLSKKRKPR